MSWLRVESWELRVEDRTARGGGHGGAPGAGVPGGCFTYDPPPEMVWQRIEE